MKRLNRQLLWLAMAAFAMSATAQNYAWPEQYEGVMLQGFYWDSYTDTRWTNLTAKADEYSNYFSLIWIPNSGYSGAGNNMGYAPQYWFSNHNSSFGTEGELRSMITAYKDRGTGIIADVVINHRNGVTNWTDFPSETWRGQTWHIGPDGICSTDEVRNQSGQPKPTGAPDTGDDFNGARDLDHTNANVQNNCKNYCLFLLQELGYAGFRYDMVKGYAGQYTRIYNEYAKPTYSVGEYWDASYDKVTAWIDATGKQSAAFDFPFKYAVNKAFSTGNLTELVWNALGITPQPAGLIHYGYGRYAVTFIDNHDTYRDASAFTGDVVAANAFMLCSPGTPCVFLPHYKAHKQELQQLINVRNSVGLHNCSEVKVVKCAKDCYMAVVKGSKGELAVRIGSTADTPDNYDSNDIVAKGDQYCVWSKTEITGTVTDPEEEEPVNMPQQMYLIGNVEGSHWSTQTPVEMVREGNAFYARNVSLTPASGETKAFFSFITCKGADWNAVNSADRYGALSKDAPVTKDQQVTFTKYAVNVNASSAASWSVAPGRYDIVADFNTMKMSVHDAGTTDIEDIPIDTNNRAEYYTLQGLHIAHPTTSGIYIVRTGHKTEKRYIKVE